MAVVASPRIALEDTCEEIYHLLVPSVLKKDIALTVSKDPFRAVSTIQISGPQFHQLDRLLFQRCADRPMKILSITEEIFNYSDLAVTEAIKDFVSGFVRKYKEV